MKFNWLISDVDGVLTCGGHFYDVDGKRYKKFGSNDKDALRELNSKYFENILFITSDKIGFDISKKRINDMGFEVKYFSIEERKEWFLKLDGKKIYLGDGIYDAELFKHADVSFSLDDSTPQAKKKCTHVLKTSGGKNVFPHLLEFLDNSTNDIDEILNNLQCLRGAEKEISNFCFNVADCYNGKNKIVFCGVGKNAVLSELICEFLYPFNIVSIFLDPHRAVHGNLGMLNKDDILILSSKSGNTEELVYMLNCLKNKMQLECKFLITSNNDCNLLNDFLFKDVLIIKNTEENSKFGLSPQTTILKYLVVFFSLINSLSNKKDISIDEYLLNHQSGEIGKVFKCIH